MKQNCWEYFQCGREPGGKKTRELGICPAAEAEKFDGVHDGKNAGRSCWVITGTNCNDDVRETSVEKVKMCTDCEFYRQVKEEERSKFIFTGTLLTNAFHEKPKSTSSGHSPRKEG
jgi:hypothetical protein